MIQRVCVAGAGSIGSLYAGHLAQVCDVVVLCRREEQARALREDGLHVSGRSELHSRVEATTDPAVGLATVFGPPLAWYDPNNGEIGDICNAIQGTSAGFVVQKEWSNAANACVDH